MRFLYLSIVLLLFHSCHTKELDPTLKPNELFSYRIVQEGDGLVSFIADSTKLISEFVWDFGDGTAQVITAISTTTHTFIKNTAYQIKLTAKNKTNQVSDVKTIIIDTRLARVFADLPANERDTINILYVLADKSVENKFQSLNGYNYSDYENSLFINFLNRTIPSHPVEWAGLVFKHVIYTLSEDEMVRFNSGGDPVAFLNQLANSPKDPLFQKILNRKTQEAASRVAFFLKDPGPYSRPKYPYAGFAPYEGAYFVSLVTSQGTISHELAHTFGFAHDTMRDCTYFPLMVGGETATRGGCGSIWNLMPELQVSGFANQLVLLEAQPEKYHYAIPEYWRHKFPNDPVVGSLTLNYITTTPYYKTDIDLSKTLTDALIAQHNIKRTPGSVTSITENPRKVGPGRLSVEAIKPLIYCPN